MQMRIHSIEINAHRYGIIGNMCSATIYQNIVFGNIAYGNGNNFDIQMNC